MIIELLGRLCSRLCMRLASCKVRRRARRSNVSCAWLKIPSASKIRPRVIKDAPNRRGASAGKSPGMNFSLSLWKNWKIVNPNPISANAVRTAAIKVRSLLRAVRSNAIAVRCDASSVATLPPMSWGG